MTLTIENINEKFLPLFQEIAKLSNARIHITQPSEIERAISEFEREQKEGKTKRYKSLDEFEKAMSE